jgi:hypothetical protein
MKALLFSGVTRRIKVFDNYIYVNIKNLFQFFRLKQVYKLDCKSKFRKCLF